MLKSVFLGLIFTSVSFMVAEACSVCGCGGGNLYMGLMPDFKYHFVGIRYHYEHYYTQLVKDPSQFSNNYYNSVEIWGGIRLGNRIQLLAFIPYYLNKQVDDDGTAKTNGLGDITIMSQYKVFHSTALLGNHQLITQQLWLGAGFKLPTGPFNANTQDSTMTVADINAQIGTGSFDFLLNGLYSLSIRNFGITVSANYKINTVNGDGYKYGNKFNGNLIAFYHFNLANTTVTPNIGIGYENVGKNKLKSQQVQFTGSDILSGIVGIEFNFGKIGLGINGQLPVAQNFAEGQTRLKFNGMMHVTFQL